MSEKKYVFAFGDKEASDENVVLLGNKGAQLSEMTRMGLPVPPGFTVSTEACKLALESDGDLPENIWEEVNEAVSELETNMGKKFGHGPSPLFVSVRSGSFVSMPGMMDTILNLGMNEKTVDAFAREINDSRPAWDSYRRFIQMFGEVVLGCEGEEFEHIINEVKNEKNVRLDTELTADDLHDLSERFKKHVKDSIGKTFPEDASEQLRLSISAVFNSWNNKRAINYRKANKLPDDAGTACNVQAMVFGNMGDDSGTGVGFTRNPATGEKEHYGEFLTNAQGEDIVAGIRTPKPIDSMKAILPDAYEELIKVYELLERHYKDMQDFEFTIEKNKLYVLQTRTGKRTGPAAAKIAVDMAKEGLINKETAVMRFKPDQLEQLLHPILDPKVDLEVIATGLAASPGAGSGKVVFTADEAEAEGEKGPVILVRQETSPDDIHGMIAAKGILTARGGMTSHAAVVARGMGKPCVAGCEEIVVNAKAKEFIVGERTVKSGDYITLDGGTGRVILGKVPTIDPQFSGEFGEMMQWTDEFRKLGVRTNADVPKDCKVAVEFGAEGIGLCRTEHMFFEKDRIPIVQRMILAESTEERQIELDKLLPIQRQDFVGIFREMKGFPVTIRLLDPPLHEFLPNREELMVEVAVAKAKGETGEELKKKENLLKRVNQLHEFNPMLGHRGCRLAISYPEIARMQATAIFEATCDILEEGKKVLPEVMIPVLGLPEEFTNQRKIIDEVAVEVMERRNRKFEYTVGTMVELPMACIRAADIAEYADFFSFGTNDLTQTTFGYSRDDSGKFIKEYLQLGILKEEPFAVLNQEGVGVLMKMAVNDGRKTNPKLKVGICGEHGGEPKSVDFCHRSGLDYVSCSPFRVPVARLAAAHAAIKEKRSK